MLLIADSGSTKTDWRLLKEDKVYKFRTPGFNPYFQDTGSIRQELILTLEPQLRPLLNEDNFSLFFYGAGCSSERKCSTVSNALHDVFPKASIEVEHDLLAAARAACGRKPGIAAILGTGSNSCYYDGEKIVENVFSLGFILGDEGSGAYLGKKILTAYLYNELPSGLQHLFHADFPFSREEFLDNLYKKPLPSRYLASFSPFLLRHLAYPEINNLVYSAIDDFFCHHISKYPLHRKVPFSCVGSIGHHFREILTRVVKDREMILETIIESPIEALVTYHRKIIS